MRLSENRKLACIVLVVVIAASILFGGGGALSRQRGELVKQYNASSFSISAELLEMRSNAVKVHSIAVKYNSADKALILALSEAISALDSACNAGDVREQYTAALQLSTGLEGCYANVSALALSEADAGDLRYAYRNFTSAQLRTTHDAYNDLAAEFNAELARFPANLIGALCGVKPLGLFQAAQSNP